MRQECFVEDGRLRLQTTSVCQRVELKEIAYCYLVGEYVCIKFVSGKDFLVSNSLSFLDMILPFDTFYRISRSVIVNILHCEEMHLFYSNCSVRMADGTVFSVSRRRYRGLKNCLRK